MDNYYRQCRKFRPLKSNEYDEHIQKNYDDNHNNSVGSVQSIFFLDLSLPLDMDTFRILNH